LWEFLSGESLAQIAVYSLFFGYQCTDLLKQPYYGKQQELDRAQRKAAGGGNRISRGHCHKFWHNFPKQQVTMVVRMICTVMLPDLSHPCFVARFNASNVAKDDIAMFTKCFPAAM
jgi:hypothetical protein